MCLCCQERIPVEEVFEHLRCTEKGLTEQEAENRLKIFGYNKLEEKKVRAPALSLNFLLSSPGSGAGMHCVANVACSL